MLQKKYFAILSLSFLTFLNLNFQKKMTVSEKNPKILEHHNFECLVNQAGGCLLGTKTLYCTGPPGQLICGPKTRSVLMTGCDGRLGNVMMAYATLLYLSKTSKYGLSAILTKYQAEMMENSFHPDAYIFKEGVVDAKGPVEGIAVMNEYGEYFYDAFLENIDKYEFNKILNVGLYPSPFYLFYKIRDELKNHFQFQEDIQNAAFEAMEQSTLKIREKYAGKKIVKIAVHARRGDYLISQMESLNFMRDDEMWREYFFYCINLFRSYGTYGLWGGLWSTGTVMYANTGRHIVEEEHSVRINSFVSTWEAIDLNRFMKSTTTATTTTTTTTTTTKTTA
ncbi:uncharacterized protein LOC111709293 isoform X3 [Eurytemora carolleeae]|uniref:uncharacterized protein LOC111709293 isoform X3 n=1 Tax=Eurytemora carolleeae TaxID=1294199 RepID=UPI000C765A05|nr:uncharacterized protein LOC111709293 isoform X3 [Eurytemora carolleeae]|eukprot:XP_023338691.1 uncharacterized protein LOC111709293 isoform X3 [Eurytemora affinis]